MTDELKGQNFGVVRYLTTLFMSPSFVSPLLSLNQRSIKTLATSSLIPGRGKVNRVRGSTSSDESGIGTRQQELSCQKRYDICVPSSSSILLISLMQISVSFGKSGCCIQISLRIFITRFLKEKSKIDRKVIWGGGGGFNPKKPKKTQTQKGISNYFWVFGFFWVFFRKRCGKYFSQHS